jgi:hypothetical protein
MVDTSKMTPTELLSTSGIEGVEEITLMAREAERFLRGHRWCRSIERGFFDRGWAGILAVFFFEIVPGEAADRAVWVITGDLPPAYMDVESCPNGAAAIDGYISAMEGWIEAAMEGGPVEGLIPVYYINSFNPMPPTREHAGLLRSRLDFLKERILPGYADELRE